MRRARSPVAAGSLALCGLIAGCVSGRVANIYVLSPPAAGPGTPSSPDAPTAHLELGSVQVPGFLDSTDILVRQGAGELVPSATGRWGERLSSGIHDALRMALQARLPAGTLVGGSRCETPARYLAISVTGFDVWADGRTVLTASWVLSARRGGSAVAVGQEMFREPAAAGGKAVGDAVLVAAMTAAVDALASRLVALVGQPIPAQSPPSSARTPPC